VSKIRRDPQVIWDEVDGVLVLCHTDSAEFFELNPTGAVVWSVCEGRTTDEVVNQLREAYPNQEGQRLAVDVRSLIRSLEEAGLVEIKRDGTTKSTTR